MPRFFIILLLCSLRVQLQAQSDSTSSLITDRPTQAATAYLLSKGSWQIETGYQLASVEQQGQIFGSPVTKAQTITFNTTLIRYGISNGVELNVTQSLTKQRLKAGNAKVDLTDAELLPTSVAARIHLANENGIMPQLAVLAGFTASPFSDVAGGTSYDFRFNAEHGLSDKWSMGYNLGGSFSDDFNTFTGLYTLVFAYAITPKFAAFAELYGSFADGDPAQHNVDYGLTYLVNNDLQFDIFAGNGLSDQAPDDLFGVGVSLRIPSK